MHGIGVVKMCVESMVLPLILSPNHDLPLRNGGKLAGKTAETIGGKLAGKKWSRKIGWKLAGQNGHGKLAEKSFSEFGLKIHGS